MSDSPARPQALLIMPSFFGYQRDIMDELERQGFEAVLVDERPSNHPVVRALMRVCRGLLRFQINSYYRAKRAALSDSRFSLVIVIKGEIVPRWFLRDLRAAHTAARFVFYAFDALQNSSNCISILDYFDDRFSFDRADVDRRPDFRYLPLFYSREFRPSAETLGREPDYFVSFIGTLHSERYRFAKQLSSIHRPGFCFFYVPAMWYFMVIKYITREQRDVDWSDVSFAPMSRTRIADVFRRSHAVIDMQRAGQSGLTMRTFEVLASGAILVTTNEAIMDEPFYDPTRVVVVPSDPNILDPGHVAEAVGALERPLAPPAGFEQYSLASWVGAVVAGRGAVSESAPIPEGRRR